APARIITTASHAHQGAHIPFDDLNAECSYRGFGRYCETKLANILFTTELARRLEGTGVTVNCFHPGLVATGFNRNTGLLRDDHPQAGSTQSGEGRRNPCVACHLAGRRKCDRAYFFDREQRLPTPEAQDPDTAGRLWEISERQCAVSGEAPQP